MEAAGKIAMTFHRKSPETWDKGGGQGPVTEADLAVDAMLKSELLAARPDYGWLSEESEADDNRLERDRVFIVDPIDGTRSFIEGGSAFSHVVAVAEKGKIIAGAIHLPALEKTYVAVIGESATCNGEAIAVSERGAIEGATVLSARANLLPEHWNGNPPEIDRTFRSSLAYRMALVADGRFDAMLTFRDAWEWDVAAGVLMVEAAGGIATGGKGEALRFNNPHPQVPGILAAGRQVHAGLLARRTGVA